MMTTLIQFGLIPLKSIISVIKILCVKNVVVVTIGEMPELASKEEYTSYE
ncbi:hypothetical protein ACFQIC_19580 [Halobacillus seohaensis]|uniref:Cyclic lactone autoinducer peptide n=1 Tax=Halobacillus seohaensis TaxID=447421 RepID=A0ABW2EP76_9BACI